MKKLSRPQKFLLFLIVALILFVLTTMISIWFGAVKIRPDWIGAILVNKTLGGIFGRELITPEWQENIASIVWDIRLPRVIESFMIGSGLALAGLGMQALTKNSLADPYVLGISSGASAGAVFVIMTGALAFLPGYRVMLGGFVGAVIAIILAVRCATIRTRMTAVQLVLAGVAVSSLFSAAVNVLIYTSSESSKQKTAMFWMIGSLAGANWTDVKILAVVFIPCLLIFFLIRKSLDVLLLGDDAAKTLGVNLGVLKLLIIIGSTLLAGSIVSMSGVIGFVGLVIPHLTRMFVGSTHKYTIPGVVLVGGVFMLWCDLISRIVAAPQEIPIGVITACIGAPFFLFMLRRGGKIGG